MQQVITQTQAKQITGGRVALTFPEYERAVVALEACLTIDDALYFSNWADAQSAWAKINHDDKCIRLAKNLKLWALIAHYLANLRGALRVNPPAQIAASLREREVGSARAIWKEIGDWAGEFLSHLPK